MISVRMSQDQIIQLGDLLLLQVVLDRGAFAVIARIDQHGVVAAGDQRGISLSHINKMDIHFVRIRCESGHWRRQSAAQQNRSSKSQIQDFLIPFFHADIPFFYAIENCDSVKH